MRVFKYRGGDENIFARDLDSLAKDTFWAPTRDMLNDPCEGLVLYNTLLQQIDLTASLLGNGSKNIAYAVDNVIQSLNEFLNP